MYDSWGDGWDGSTVTVQVNGSTVASGTVLFDSAALTFEACTSDNISLVYFNGGGIYENEVSYSLTLNGSQIYSSDFLPSSGVNYNATADCDFEVESEGPTSCLGMDPICTDDGLSFTATSNGGYADFLDPGNNYACLFLTPNPTWYYLEIEDSGNIDMNLNAPQDIDYAIWGPFDDLDDAQGACGSLGQAPTSANGSLIDCSFDPTEDEYPIIPNAQTGDVYVMLITNYASVVQDITLQQTGGTGSTNCDILCEIVINYTITPCADNANTYTLSGQIELEDTPSSGSFTLQDCSGNAMTYNAPFSNSYNFNFTGLSADGSPCSLTASFTDESACEYSEDFTAPSPCCEDPSYAVDDISCFDECDGQIVIEGNGAAPFDYSLENSIDNSVIASITNSSTEQTFSNLCGGQYTIYVTDVEDCTTEVSFQLDNPEDLTILTEELIGCASLDYNGNTYFTSQTVVETFLSVNGCDSIVTAEITVLPIIPDTVNDIELCQGQIHVEGPETYFTDGTYSYTYLTSSLCDSTVVTNITLIPLIEHTEFVTTCIGSTYTVAGNTYWTGGTFTNLLQTADGCDSLLTTVLDFNEIVTEQDIQLCYGLVHNENGDYYTEAGTYSYTYINATASGCDSTVITNLTIVDPTTTTANVIGCFGTPYIFNGNPITTSGTYTDVFDSQYCTQDSSVTLNIFFLPPQITTNNIDLCEGETIDIEGVTYDNSTQVTNMYTNMFGCDSIVTTTITVAPVLTNALTESICDGESIDINGTTYSTAQDVVNVYPSVLGCDSTVTTTIVVNPLVTFNESVTICDGETATVNGTDYTTAQDVVNVYTSVLGCDSTVTTTIVVNPLVTFNESVTICDGETATVNGTDYTTAQDVVNVYPSVLGCDSTVTTTIVVNPLVTFNESVTICDGETATVNGTDYTTAQDVVNVYTSVLGCDSTVTTTIVVNPLVTFNESVTICDGETATVNGTDYTTAQDVVNVYPSVLGCDSTVTTTIVVNPLVTFNESVTICDGETATVNGTDYTTAQDVVNVYTSVLGCDSTVTTTIVVNPLVTFDESVTICDGETATVNGTDYTTAQDVVNVYPSVLGCDSTVTTTIVVNPLVTFNESVTICDGETATVNGTDLHYGSRCGECLYFCSWM